MAVKLNTLLAKTDHLGSSFKSSLLDYVRFFKTEQGAFKGEKKTYEANLGTIDQPGERGNKLVVTTVKEKMDWFQNNSKEYIDALFAQEATNAAGCAKAELLVDNKSFGMYSSLELLRLKSLLEQNSFEEMYANLPTRNEDELWVKTTSDLYTDREVFESNLQTGINRTTIKESYILPDPNASIAPERYIPQVATKDTPVELGQYTRQRFSGETSHIERAGILQRRTKLLTAVVEALKIANDVEAISSEMTSDKLFNYLHKGTV
jgi:hypothetical protein